MTSSRLPLPPRPIAKSPVLGWSSGSGPRSSGLPALDDAPAVRMTTSGRAAIAQALRLLGLPAGSTVAVPSYHCPTMVAPVVALGLRPVFYALDARGLPRLDTLPEPSGPSAVLVSHLFGQAQSLSEVRAWCDAHQVALIEDCAHAFFGQAGERPVGHWGDFATGSLTKFFPVTEAGVLTSTRLALPELPLSPQGWTAELRSVWHMLQHSARHHALTGPGTLLRALQAPTPVPSDAPSTPPTAQELMIGSDLGRIQAQVTGVAHQLYRRLPRGRIVAQRQKNYRLYFEQLQPWLAQAPADAPPTAPRADSAPYVFPLWIEHKPDEVYHGLRKAGYPVYRWDRRWPDVPHWADDCGPRWSQHVLQLCCHQDLAEADVRRTVDALHSLTRP